MVALASSVVIGVVVVLLSSLVARLREVDRATAFVMGCVEKSRRNAERVRRLAWR